MFFVLALQRVGYDISYYTKAPDQGWFDCMVQNNYSFAVFEAQVGRTFSKYALLQYRRAVASGIDPADIDFYIYPNFQQTAFDQVYLTLSTLRDAGALNGHNRVWLDVENAAYWSTDCATNQQFVRDAVRAAEGFLSKEQIGFYTNANYWEPIMCGTTEFSEHPLWFPSNDNTPDLETNFKPTGGWEKATMKQYSLDAPICGEKSVDSSYREE